MADILLIMPLANRFDKASPRVPSGLLAVAAPSVAAGWSVEIIDLKIEDDWRQRLREGVDSETACVGITCSTGRMVLGALEVAAEVRSIDPNVPIVWGGPHPTLVPEQTLEHPLVDYITINEGDESFHELAVALKEGTDVSAIAGIAYVENGKPVFTERRALMPDMAQLKPTPYQLIDVSKYSSLDIHHLPSIDVLTSRGCPFNCGFCSTPATSERKWRPYPVERVVGDVELLYHEHGVRTFYFVDDNFMVDLKRVSIILEKIRERGMTIYWGTQGVRVDSINRMSPEFIDMLEASGCRELSVGVESGNPNILKLIDKQIKIDDVLQANEKLSGRKIAIKYSMIVGFPGEDMEQVKNTVNLALRIYEGNKKAWFPFNIYTPFPATPMFDESIRHGFTPPQKLEDWARLESVGWERYYNHWMSHEDNELLRSINFTSYLAFPSARQKISNTIIRWLFDLYRPVAWLRFRYMWYHFHIERFILEKFEEWRSPSASTADDVSPEKEQA
ncbi:MAG: B12-binding domain-containing radical SAM protein [Pseudodesulfovibrio sp.]